MPAKKRFSAMQFSLKRLRDQGHTCCIVEQSMTFPDKDAPKVVYYVKSHTEAYYYPADPQPALRGIPIKRDAWNIADVIAIKLGEMGTLYVQTTTVANQQERIKKILQNPILTLLLSTGNKVHVHGWSKKHDKAKNRDTWQLTIHEMTLWPTGQITAEKLKGDDPSEKTLFDTPSSSPSDDDDFDSSELVGTGSAANKDDDDF